LTLDVDEMLFLVALEDFIEAGRRRRVVADKWRHIEVHRGVRLTQEQAALDYEHAGRKLVDAVRALVVPK
jgi:hypothetical protein